MENLLTAPIIDISPNGKHSLAGLLAAMARDEVRGFPAQRPHQRAAWHMFLVQLAALALWTAGRDDLPETEDDWRIAAGAERRRGWPLGAERTG